jgi:hypothetical protein
MDLEAFIIFQHGVIVYTPILTICTQDPNKIFGKTIESSSFSTITELHIMTKHIAIGDETTWGGAAGARHTGATMSPWHSRLEVECHLKTSAERSRSRRTRLEELPFDHQRRQKKGIYCRCPP